MYTKRSSFSPYPMKKKKKRGVATTTENYHLQRALLALSQAEAEADKHVRHHPRTAVALSAIGVPAWGDFRLSD